MYYFEIVECLRKLAIVCVPVFFNPAGSPAQLIFGLMVCSVTSVMYATWRPYHEHGNMKLALVAQVQLLLLTYSLTHSLTYQLRPSTWMI